MREALISDLRKFCAGTNSLENSAALSTPAQIDHFANTWPFELRKANFFHDFGLRERCFILGDREAVGRCRV